MLKIKDNLKRLSYDLTKEALQIYALVNEAEKELSDDLIRRASSTAVRIDEVDIVWTKIEGIVVPKIVYSDYFPKLEDRGYYLPETNSMIDKASEEIHSLVYKLIKYADLINRQRVLHKELKKIEVRYKALDHVLIPSLASQKKLIAFKLEENEREDIVRVKKIKKFLELKRLGEK